MTILTRPWNLSDFGIDSKIELRPRCDDVVPELGRVCTSPRNYVAVASRDLHEVRFTSGAMMKERYHANAFSNMSLLDVIPNLVHAVRTTPSAGWRDISGTVHKPVFIHGTIDTRDRTLPALSLLSGGGFAIVQFCWAPQMMLGFVVVTYGRVRTGSRRCGLSIAMLHVLLIWSTLAQIFIFMIYRYFAVNIGNYEIQVIQGLSIHIVCVRPADY